MSDVPPGGETPPNADPNSDPKKDDPSSPPAPKSDIERLRESKDKWKAEALEAKRKLEAKELEEKQRAEDELRRKEEFKTLAEQKGAEAATEKARADAAEEKLAEVETQRKAELDALLKDIPEDKRPPLDDSMSTEKKLQLVNYVRSTLNLGPKPPSGGIVPKDDKPNDQKETRKKELASKQHLSSDEAFEALELSGTPS